MRKFKLIQEYPGSLKHGDVVILSNSGFYIQDIDTNINKVFDNSQIENQPKYWQEIFDITCGDTDNDGNCGKCLNNPDICPNRSKKDYEILSFICIKHAGYEQVGTILNKRSNNSFWNYPQWTEDKMLKLKHYKIHSVKRLSDGEVFNIGDKVNGVYSKEKVILNFFTHTSGCISVKTNEGLILLKDLKKSKQKLFTTEDGVDIFDKGFSVFAIKRSALEAINGNGNTIGAFLNGWYTTDVIPNPKDNDQDVLRIIKERFLFFSTKKAAEEYILINKPCLSINDIIKESSIKGDCKYVNYLKNLVKSRLKVCRLS